MYFAISLDAPQPPPYPSIRLDPPRVDFHWGQPLEFIYTSRPTDPFIHSVDYDKFAPERCRIQEDACLLNLEYQPQGRLSISVTATAKNITTNSCGTMTG